MQVLYYSYMGVKNMKLTTIISLSGIVFLTVIFTACGSTKVEAVPVVEEVVVQEEVVPAEKSEEEKEYERSIGDTGVSLDTFNQDKNAILAIINELADVMKSYNYNAWLTYLDDASISYWSKKPNLSAAQKKLPVKGLQLRTLEDYFKHVFVPARRGKQVTEIRYISDKNIKAVQVQEDVDIVYYNFNKINNVWKLHIPENE